jgi:hypothetical protein
MDFTKLKYDNHEALVIEINIGDISSDIQRENYPITTTVEDALGQSHSLTIDEGLNLSIINEEEEDTAEQLSYNDLYKLMYGIDTEDGQQTAFDYESSYYGPSQYDHENLADATDDIEKLTQEFSFSYQPQKIRIQALPHLNILRYYSLSLTGNIVAIKDYDQQATGKKWQHKGVFRLPIKRIKDSDHVIVVDDPLTADYLLENDLCAITLPSEGEVQYYNYAELFDDAEIFFCLSKYGQNFSYSLYPFASELLGQGVSIFKVNLFNRLANQSIPNWLHKHDRNQFLDFLKSNSTKLYPSDIPARNDFDTNRPGEGTVVFNPAQDVVKGSLVYSFNEEQTILSNPLRSFTHSELPVMEHLEPNHDVPVQSNLDEDMIERIKQGDYLNPSQLYTFIRSFIKRFLYFKHEPVFDILTAWVIASYFHRMTQAFPYLHFLGERGTGKTTILEILSNLSFNGKHLTKATPSSLIHQVHHHSSTLCIDEFEDYSSKRKSEDDLSRFLNGGYHYKGSYEKRSGSDNVELSTYSPKAFGGTGEIFIDTLKSRAIQIKTVEKPKRIPKDQFIEFDSQIAEDIRLIQLSCFAFGLTNTSTLFDAVSSMPTDIRLPVSNIKLDNRKLQLAKPLLTVANLVDSHNAKQYILEGLDICWYEEAANQSQLLNAIRDILKAFFKEHDPDDKDSVHCKFITKKLWEYDLKKDFAEDYEVLRRKGKFNELIEHRFGIRRDSQYANSTQQNESLYLIPKTLVQELQD